MTEERPEVGRKLLWLRDLSSQASVTNSSVDVDDGCEKEDDDDKYLDERQSDAGDGGADVEDVYVYKRYSESTRCHAS